MTTAASGDNTSTFKDLLKGYRLRARLTQQELSEASGISIRSISDMERGIARGPRSHTLNALSSSLDLTSNEAAELREVATRGRPHPAAGSASTLRGCAPPSDLDDLAGRAEDIDLLRTLTKDLRSLHLRSGRVAVVSGPPGVGKTSLAVRTAHELADDFPDGCLFLKLHGMSHEPRHPSAVLHSILRALGVDAQAIPADLDERTGLCRMLLKDRAMLIVLDDAADETQVRPLLVGGGRCLTLITSRQMLVGLKTSRRLPLEVLDEGSAIAFLASIVGERVKREHAAAVELVNLCDRLPLALRIAANRLASRPGWSLSQLVEQLRDRGNRLTTLAVDDLSIRRVIELSYRQLSTTAAMVFRRLSLVPATDFSTSVVMPLVDAECEHDVLNFLEELVDCSLLQASDREGRYEFHDLLAAFAGEQLAEDDSDATRAAQERLTDWLVGTTITAFGYFRSYNFHPAEDQKTETPVDRLPFSDAPSARRWLIAEADNWITVVRRVAADGKHLQLNALAHALPWFLDSGEPLTASYEVFDLAIESAVAIGSKRDESTHRINVSFMQAIALDQPHAAIKSARLAGEAATAAGDLTNQGWAKVALMNGYLYAGTPPESAALLDDADRLFEEDGCQFGQLYGRIIRAGYWHGAGLLTEAAAEFEVCISLFEADQSCAPNLGLDNAHAYLLLQSSHNLAALNAPDLALSRCDEAFRLYDRSHSSVGKALALQASGRIQSRRAQYADALERLSKALELFEVMGMARCQGDTLCELADLAKLSGDTAAAR